MKVMELSDVAITSISSFNAGQMGLPILGLIQSQSRSDINCTVVTDLSTSSI